MNKKLLFITSRLLWPIDGGRKMSLNYYCKGLHERFGYDIYLYCFLENGQNYDGTHPDYIKEVYIADEVKITEKIRNVFNKTFGPKRWPFQCSAFYSKSNKIRISQICQELKPDVIFTEMIRTSTYYEAFKDIDAIKISNLDDMLSKRYFRQAVSTVSKADVAGAYATKLPKMVNRIIRNKWIRKCFLKTEGKLCSKWEKKFYNQYDYVMFTSPVETHEMNRLMGKNKAITLSVGIDYDLFSRKIDLNKERNTLSYVGNFKVAANCDTLRMICSNILPLLRHDYTFYVIGACPGEVSSQYESNPRIVFTGRVDDLTEAVKKTEIFLSPISYGTGIKTKIVEAMAMGMPVVTNDIGAEGIAAVNEEHYIIENEYVRIAEWVDKLLDDEPTRNMMGAKAMQFAYSYFRWDVVYEAFEKAGL